MLLRRYTQNIVHCVCTLQVDCSSSLLGFVSRLTNEIAPMTLPTSKKKWTPLLQASALHSSRKFFPDGFQLHKYCAMQISLFYMPAVALHFGIRSSQSHFCRNFLVLSRCFFFLEPEHHTAGPIVERSERRIHMHLAPSHLP